LLQCCKELVDNSVAACLAASRAHQVRGDPIAATEINVNLTQTHQCPPGTVLVEVTDSGCGIAEMDSIVQFFSSSSPSTAISSPTRTCRGGRKSQKKGLAKVKGQYGVGLTTCLLYSQLNTHQPLRLATKTLDHAFCSCLDVSFDTASGKHSVQQQVLLEHSNFASGTRVVLYMPLPASSAALSHVIGMLDVYFDRLSIMPSCGGSPHTAKGSSLATSQDNPVLRINFRVSTFQQSYQGVYTNTSLCPSTHDLAFRPEMSSNAKGSDTSAPSPSPSDYCSFLTQQFGAFHARTLPRPQSTMTATRVYEERVYLGTRAIQAPSTKTRKKPTTGRDRSDTSNESSKRLRRQARAVDGESESDSDNGTVSGTEGGEASESYKSLVAEHDAEEQVPLLLKSLEDLEVVVSAALLFSTSTTTSTADAGRVNPFMDSAASAEDMCLEGVRGVGGSIPLELWRYANHSPLLDEDDDVSSEKLQMSNFTPFLVIFCGDVCGLIGPELCVF